MPFALTNNPTPSEISDALNYLLANFGSNLIADPSNGQISGPSGVIIAYLYRYIAVKYADSFDGSVNFGDSPTNKAYYGLRNSDDPVESSNSADYIWYKVAGGGFGTTKFLFYKTSGGRQISFFVSTASPATGFVPAGTGSIDLDVITTSTPSADTFAAFFQPTSLQVPRTGSPLTPSFSGITPAVYGINGSLPVDFVTSQSDSDGAFVNNTWRIGASSTTGNADIVYTNITIGSPTDGGTYAVWPNPTAMASSPASIYVPVRYKNSLGVVTQSIPAQIQLIFVDQGTSGDQNAEANLYQWSISTPGNPSGSSTYTWATGANSAYTGGNGWSTGIPTNPGVPLLILWVASKKITAPSGTTTSSVSWTSGYSIAGASQNGDTGPAGSQSAKPTVYQWAVSIPGISGTSTYTWATGGFSPPTGWSTSISTAPSPGFTLWAASVNLYDASSATTSTINWTTASIIAAGYAGDTGGQGASSRLMYARIAGNPQPVSGTVTVSGDNRPTGAQASAVWGSSFNVTWYANDPDPTSNNSLYQADGIYDGVSSSSWSTPYISSLKVGNLQAVSTNTGNLTVTGTIQVNTAAISGTTMTGSGAVIYSSGLFALGNSTTNLTFNGSSLNLNGPIVNASNLNVGSLAAVSTSTGSLNVTGTIQSGTAAISGTTMTGSGGVLYSTGNFAFGNSTTNITYNGSSLTLNGPVVSASNLSVSNLSAVSASTGSLNVTGTIQAGSAAISGTTMTGAGGVLYSSGNFSFGNSSTNITFNGSAMYLNGNVVATGNINTNAVTLTSSAFTSATYSNTSANTWQDAQTLSITTSGSQVYVTSSGSPVEGSYTDTIDSFILKPLFRLVRDSTVLMTGNLNPSMSYSETPSAGTYTYKLQVYSGLPQYNIIQTYAGISNRSLFAIETKR